MALENQLGLDALKQGKLIEKYRDEDGNERTRVRGPTLKIYLKFKPLPVKLLLIT
jgi:hypothetical protein